MTRPELVGLVAIALFMLGAWFWEEQGERIRRTLEDWRFAIEWRVAAWAELADLEWPWPLSARERRARFLRHSVPVDSLFGMRVGDRVTIGGELGGKYGYIVGEVLEHAGCRAVRLEQPTAAAVSENPFAPQFLAEWIEPDGKPS